MQAVAHIRALPIASRFVVALSCGLVVLLGQALLAYRTVLTNRAAAQSAQHAREVIGVASDALTAVIELQNAGRGYMLTGDETFLAHRALQQQVFGERFGHLRLLTADNPDQLGRWERIEARLELWEQGPVRSGIAVRGPSGGTPPDITPLVRQGQAAIADVRGIFGEVIAFEQAVENDWSRAAEAANALLTQVMLFGTLATAVVGLGLALLMAGDMRAELARVAAAARAIAAGDLDRRVGKVHMLEIARTAAAVDRVGEGLKRDMERLRAIIAAQTEIARAELQPERLFALGAERARTLTGASGAVIEIAEGDELVHHAVSGTAQQHLGMRLKLDGSLSGRSVQTGETLHCEDARHDPRVDAAACERIGIGSMVVAPLVHEGRRIGALKVWSAAPGAFLPGDVDTLQLAAHLLGAALDHAQAFRDKERSEARLRAATESAHEAIISAGPQGWLVAWNPAAIRLFGYGADELRDMRYDTLLPDPAAIIDSAQGGGSTLTTCGQRKDGTQFTLEMSVASWQSEGQTYWTGIMHDVTERQMIERMKDELISVVSHELRTPLTRIRGSLGLLAGGLLRNAPDKAQRMLDIAVDNTDRLIRLINDFLDLERLQSGQVELRPQPSLASELVLKATDEMRAMAQTAAVELRPHADATALSVDPDRVVQVLTNLLSNAIKFSPAGGVVEVSAQAQGGMVLFAVEDHGRGIPADKLETIFGRFQQVDPSDARRGSGTGLGLAICRSIVDQHGGRLWAESVEGQGSTFKVLLPARFVARPRTSVAA